MYKTPDIPTLKPGRMLTIVFPLLLSNCSKQLKSFPVHHKANLAQTKKKKKDLNLNLFVHFFPKTRHNSHCLTAPEDEEDITVQKCRENPLWGNKRYL